MADQIKTRPATPEFRDGYDRIFSSKPGVPRSVDEIYDCMIEAGAGRKVIVLDVSGTQLGCVVTENAKYNRKLAAALFRSVMAPHCTYKTYEIEGALRTPETRAALDRSMRIMNGVGQIRAGQ
jgi:hypothetical protein